MSKLLAILTIFLVGGILLVLAIGYANTQAAERDRAEAVVIRAQAESRLTSATAQAVISAALLPWGVLLVLGVLGLSVMALAGAIIVRPPKPPVERIETRTVVYLPAPGQPRWKIWQGISDVSLLEQPQVITIDQPRYQLIGDEK